MDTSPNLRLAYIAAAQAQKHVTHNEALRALDVVVQLAVVDRDLAVPPTTVADGDRYIVPAGATGAWSGHAAKIAAFQDGTWAFLTARPGWLAWIVDEAMLVVFDGTTWIAATTLGGGTVNPTPFVGVNATADIANRLSVKSPATLFDHEGAGHHAKVNKAAAANTAALLFQTGYSSRAEIGTTGDDDFHLKVTADGSAWTEALIVDRVSGAVALPQTPAPAFSNLALNGDFSINQRGFGGGLLAAGVYGHDRWKAATGGASYTVSGGVVTLASGELEQVIEPAVWGFASLALQRITISLENPTSDVTATFGGASGVIVAGSGRRSVSFITAATDTGNVSLKLRRVGTGALSFSRVRLETGPFAGRWTPRPAQLEFDLCRRYYQRTYPLGAVTGAANTVGIAQMVAASSVYTAGLKFPVPMRAVPTMTMYSRSGTINKATDFLNGSEVTLALSSINAQGIWFGTGSGLIVSNFYEFNYTASAEL